MESLHDTTTPACFMDDLLDFASDIGEEDDEEEHSKNKKPRKARPSLNPTAGFDAASFNLFDPDEPLPDFPEEELEWLSNKDAFPTLESCFTIFPENSVELLKHNSPVSVLDNSSSTSSNSNNSGSNNGGGGGGSATIMSYCRNLHVPVKARSKLHRRLREELKDKKVFWWSEENLKSLKGMKTAAAAAKVVKTGRKCLHCGSEKTPQWRAGPEGPKTLCNACGVRFKSGRLVPEYRPANSPTFSSQLHSNSHRKVLEMRRQKQMMGLPAAKPMDKG
ncbi:hypothetical protein Tsubulata_015470 [Turnera subulata]|uniref:GATA-type domain-containing protein n=1 Tax=Turnera subulata TaxID=218843 RepID=A0A9Q0GFG2_9ROSI|nr:hypothetical protein Tsubulata_015470 [Turnera subulata]